jgi:SAM-dependent methyltransferase
MATDAQVTAEFYGTPRGAVAARLLAERLVDIWPRVAGSSLLGVGYAAPYLLAWRETAARCIALMPAHHGMISWPPGGPNLSCTAEEDALPFADLSFDRILLVHGLEAAENARRLLREIWRVLKDDGRVLVVTPNRLGMWAHAESTPFGQGQPYSPSQVGQLLAGALFRVERTDTALFLPPSRSSLVLRSACLWERAGRLLAPSFSGVTISEGVKDVYAAVPQGAQLRRRIVLADAA